FVGLRPSRGLAMAGVFSVGVAVTSLAIGNAVLPSQQTAGIPDTQGQLAKVLGTPGASPPVASPPGASPPAASPPSQVESASPSATGSPAPPSPRRTPTPIPATPGGPVPRGLQPPLVRAHQDLPAVYADGCQATELATSSGPCVYGDPNGRTT